MRGGAAVQGVSAAVIMQGSGLDRGDTGWAELSIPREAVLRKGVRKALCKARGPVQDAPFVFGAA